MITYHKPLMRIEGLISVAFIVIPLYLIILWVLIF